MTFHGADWLVRPEREKEEQPEQMLDALDGKPVPRIVNPQVWLDYAKRFERAFGFKPQDPPAEPNWHAFEN